MGAGHSMRLVFLVESLGTRMGIGHSMKSKVENVNFGSQKQYASQWSEILQGD